MPKTLTAEAEKTPGARSVKKRPATAGTRKGNGKGWGGEAKGTKPPRARDLPADVAGPGRGHVSVIGEDKRAKTEHRINALLDNLYHLSFNAEAETARIQATVHALNRYDGMPVQRVVASGVDDLTDEERAAQIAAFRSATVGLALPRGPHGMGDPGVGADESDAGAAPSGTATAS